MFVVHYGKDNPLRMFNSYRAAALFADGFVNQSMIRIEMVSEVRAEEIRYHL